jgi:hypothetical protein
MYANLHSHTCSFPKSTRYVDGKLHHPYILRALYYDARSKSVMPPTKYSKKNDSHQDTEEYATEMDRLLLQRNVAIFMFHVAFLIFVLSYGSELYSRVKILSDRSRTLDLFQTTFQLENKCLTLSSRAKLEPCEGYPEDMYVWFE